MTPITLKELGARLFPDCYEPNQKRRVKKLIAAGMPELKLSQKTRLCDFNDVTWWLKKTYGRNYDT